MYPGNTFAMDWVKKRMYAWQAYLKSISHYLIKGEFGGILLNQVMFVLMMVEMILNLSITVHV